MIRKSLVAAAAGIAVLAAASLAPSRAQAMPLGLPAGAIDQIDMTQAVALCFYIDGWNGPGLYQCGYRLRRGLGWHGHRDGQPGHRPDPEDLRPLPRRGGRRPGRIGFPVEFTIQN